MAEVRPVTMDSLGEAVCSLVFSPTMPAARWCVALVSMGVGMRYRLKLTNRSGKPGNMLLLQRWRGAEVTLAWMSRYADVGEAAQFEWDDEDCLFTFSTMGVPEAGVPYLATTIVSADPDAHNQITMSFDADLGAPVFGPVEQGPAGVLTINIAPAAGFQGVAVGFGMAGRATFIWPAWPGFMLTMDQQVEYWAAFGGLREGTVINDFDALKALPLVFSAGKRSISATVNAGGEWTLDH